MEGLFFKKFVRYCKPSFYLGPWSLSDFPCLVEIVESNHFREHVSTNSTKTGHAHSLKGKNKHVLLLKHIYQLEPLFWSPHVCILCMTK